MRHRGILQIGELYLDDDGRLMRDDGADGVDLGPVADPFDWVPTHEVKAWFQLMNHWHDLAIAGAFEAWERGEGHHPSSALYRKGA